MNCTWVRSAIWLHLFWLVEKNQRRPVRIKAFGFGTVPSSTQWDAAILGPDSAFSPYATRTDPRQFNPSHLTHVGCTAAPPLGFKYFGPRRPSLVRTATLKITNCVFALKNWQVIVFVVSTFIENDVIELKRSVNLFLCEFNLLFMELKYGPVLIIFVGTNLSSDLRSVICLIQGYPIRPCTPAFESIFRSVARRSTRYLGNHR